MDLVDYLDVSGRWLIDTTSIYDLAEALSRAMNHSYVIPTDSSNWASGPFLNSWHGIDKIQAAIPLLIRTSIESAKAAELVMGKNHLPDKDGKTIIPFVNKTNPRPGAILARAGIISQFELWKEFAKPLGYPTNEHKAEKYVFNSLDEKDLLLSIVSRRNSLTHEIKTQNDSNMRELVEYAYSCHFLAKKAAGVI